MSDTLIPIAWLPGLHELWDTGTINAETLWDAGWLHEGDGTWSKDGETISLSNCGSQ